MSTLQWVMAGFGAFGMLLGFVMLVTRIRTVVKGCKVDATVVDEKVEISRSKNGKEIRVSTPIFEFTHEGKKYRAQSTFGSSSTALKRGSKVPVRYLPSSPATTAEIDRFLPFWGLPLVALPLGAALVWVGMGGLK